MLLLPRPRREFASALAPTQRRAPPREMAPPRGRRRDQPRASGERRSAATMRRKAGYVFSSADGKFFRRRSATRSPRTARVRLFVWACVLC